MIEAHYNAVKAALEADPDLSGKVYPSARLDDAGGLVRGAYVIVYPTAPLELQGRFGQAVTTGSLPRATFVFDIRAVSTTALAAGRLLDKIMAQLLGARLTVTGRRVDAVRLESVGRVEPDASITPPLFYGDAAFRVVSRL